MPVLSRRHFRLQLPGKFTTANFTEAAVVQTGSPVFGSCERQRKRGRPSQQQNREAKSSAAPLQAKLEPASPPPTSGGIGSNSNSSNPTPSFSSIYENLVGSGRPDKKPKAKRAATSASGAPSRWVFWPRGPSTSLQNSRALRVLLLRRAQVLGEKCPQQA